MPGFQATGVIKMKVSLQHECNQVSVGQFDDGHKEVVVSAQTGAFLYGSEIMDSTEELFIKIDGKSITIFGFEGEEEKEFVVIRNGNVSVNRSR